MQFKVVVKERYQGKVGRVVKVGRVDKVGRGGERKGSKVSDPGMVWHGMVQEHESSGETDVDRLLSSRGFMTMQRGEKP